MTEGKKKHHVRRFVEKVVSWLMDVEIYINHTIYSSTLIERVKRKSKWLIHDHSSWHRRSHNCRNDMITTSYMLNLLMSTDATASSQKSIVFFLFRDNEIENVFFNPNSHHGNLLYETVFGQCVKFERGNYFNTIMMMMLSMRWYDKIMNWLLPQFDESTDRCHVTYQTT